MDDLKELMISAGEKINILQLNPLKENNVKLIWIKKGISKIFAINDSGVKVNTDLIFENEYFLVSHDNYKSSDLFFIESLKYSEMYCLPLGFLNSSQMEQLNLLLIDFYNARLQRIHQQKVKNHDLELEERVFFLLADFCRIFGEKKGQSYVMPNFFTHEDLASMLKTCRQNITSVLSGLKKRRLLYYNRKEIRFEKAIFESSKVLNQPHIQKNKTISLC
ncbi:Crp/Fnr family transcriptional regulator [Arthrospiribacter ruber]|uniref:Crp/Fnr family transcriptional regulator n=1 Tax=Arthrospiribacter ruber TaxID=2487934 RepID=A0A951IW31_9BACT|nr:Crp/Fnr family transcriptional regulator [Arthrospiribacter ruber]MBW3468225.1 Crp/Fnr family transcriptional regulator [Arthrospiribacter ruber]